MRKHPEMLYWSIEEQYNYVHEAGDMWFMHPSVRSYIPEIRLFPEYVDAVETYNGGNKRPESDLQSRRICKAT